LKKRFSYFLFFGITITFIACKQKKILTKNDGTVKKTEIKTENDLDKKVTNYGIVKEKLNVSNKEIKDSKMYNFIVDWYGVPYKYGGCQKSGVDCSCFTNNLYSQVYGKKLPRSSGNIYKECSPIKSEKLRQGDFVFFKINSKNISHVGVFLKDTKFVHASTSKGVMVSDLNDTFYKKYFFAAGRLKAID
jgi:murein DD-endopeptidase / murein LD-carboxypeptidase